MRKRKRTNGKYICGRCKRDYPGFTKEGWTLVCDDCCNQARENFIRDSIKEAVEEMVAEEKK